MNILLMHFGTEFGPEEEQVIALGSSLAAMVENRLFFVCQAKTPLHEAAIERKLEVLTISASAPAKYFNNFKIKRLLRNMPAQWIIHTNDSTSVLTGAKLLKKNPDYRLVHSRRSGHYDEDEKVSASLRMASAVACETQEIAYIMAIPRITPKALQVIPGGIDPAKYPRRQPKKDRRLLIGCPTALEEGKGQEILIRSMEYLNKAPDMRDLPSWELRFSEDGPMFDSLLEEAKKLGLEGNMAFLGGQSPASIMPSCDILVAPALVGERSSLAIKQGWAMGLPVICSDIMPHVEMVQPRVDVLTYKHEDPLDLANKIREVLLNREMADSLVQAGFESLKNFTFDSIAKRYMNLYSRVQAEKLPETSKG